jgi:hypothetical protein
MRLPFHSKRGILGKRYFIRSLSVDVLVFWMREKVGIVIAGMLIECGIGSVIPFSAGVLVVSGCIIAFQGVVHQHLPVIISFGELPYPAPGGDGIES